MSELRKNVSTFRRTLLFGISSNKVFSDWHIQLHCLQICILKEWKNAKTCSFQRVVSDLVVHVISRHEMACAEVALQGRVWHIAS